VHFGRYFKLKHHENSVLQGAVHATKPGSKLEHW